jgi:hypothetical protein
MNILSLKHPFLEPGIEKKKAELTHKCSTWLLPNSFCTCCVLPGAQGKSRSQEGKGTCWKILASYTHTHFHMCSA